MRDVNASGKDTTTRRPLTEGRYRWARAYRDGQLVCGRVELTVTADLRLGLAPRERRCLAARFLERLDPALRSELSELVRRRGAAAGRAAERMRPVELVFDDRRAGRQRIVGRVSRRRYAAASYTRSSSICASPHHDRRA